VLVFRVVHPAHVPFGVLQVCGEVRVPRDDAEPAGSDELAEAALAQPLGKRDVGYRGFESRYSACSMSDIAANCSSVNFSLIRPARTPPMQGRPATSSLPPPGPIARPAPQIVPYLTQRLSLRGGRGGATVGGAPLLTIGGAPVTFLFRRYLCQQTNSKDLIRSIPRT